MPVLLLNVSLPSVDMSLDGMSNDFVYAPVGTGVADVPTASALASAVVGFYNTHSGTMVQAVGSYFALSLQKSAGFTVRVYDITSHLAVGAIHGPPIATISTAASYTAAGSASPMPEGVAMALSYRADYGTLPEFIRDPVTHKVTGRPRATKRGRIYVGPLIAAAFTNDSTTFRTKILPQFGTDCMKSLQNINQLHDASSNPWLLQVWSKKNASVSPLVETWYDDRPDYQRRRADQSTVRGFLGLP